MLLLPASGLGKGRVCGQQDILCCPKGSLEQGKGPEGREGQSARSRHLLPAPPDSATRHLRSTGSAPLTSTQAQPPALVSPAPAVEEGQGQDGRPGGPLDGECRTSQAASRLWPPSACPGVPASGHRAARVLTCVRSCLLRAGRSARSRRPRPRAAPRRTRPPESSALEAPPSTRPRPGAALKA